MKRNLISGISSVMGVTLLAATVLAGCGGSNSDSSASSSSSDGGSGEEPYNVTFMYLVPNEGADLDKVEQAISDLALEEINMTVDLIPVTWGTYVQQLQLMLAGNETLDLAPILSSSVGTYMSSGYLVDMTDLLEEYGQDIIATLGEEDAKACNLDGKIWGVTMMKERANPTGLFVRADICDELGINTDEIETLDDITAMFEKVQEAYPNMTMFGGNYQAGIGNMINTYDGLGDMFGVLENYGQELTVTNWFESDEFIERCQVARDWYEKGYTSQDIATSNDSGEVLIAAGNLFSFYGMYKPNSLAEKKSQTGYDMYLIPMSGQPMRATSVTNSQAYAIANASKDPAKAMQFLNWAYTSEKFNNLLNWGIEGEHYVVTDEGVATYPDGVTSETVGYHMDYGYAYPNQFLAYPWEGNDADVWDQYEEFKNECIVSKAYGFAFDQTSVTNEVNALTPVLEQYYYSLSTGAVDPDTEIDAFNDALYAAGLQKVMDEKQSQLDAWFAAQN